MSPATVVMKLLVLFIVCEVVYAAGLTCKDMNGNKVDWYYVYKLPKITKHPHPFIEKGVAFYSLDNYQQKFQLSESSMEERSQPIAQTLQQIYDQPHMIAYYMYNDQPPDGTEKHSRGHTKGVVAYDDNTGFWMIHSLPKFPRKDTYQWVDNASPNGQSILCVSVNSSEMEKIANQMLFNYPNVYSSNLPPDKVGIAPTFQKVVNGVHVENPPWTHKVSLESCDRQNFTHYAKFNSFGKDLYLDMVAPDLQSNLLVETWQRLRPLPSNCSFGYCVQNIRAIQFSSLAVEFNSTKDHSKWAVSDARDKVICVGDINRAHSQYQRAGGTLCTSLPNVWQQYRDSVAQVEPLSVEGPYPDALKIVLAIVLILVLWYMIRYVGQN